MEIKTFVFNDFSENTYVVYDETKEAIIFDPGCNSSNERKMLAAYIRENDLEVKYLINTHCHIDHILGNSFVAESYKLPLMAHEDEVQVLDKQELVAQMYGISLDPSPSIAHFIADEQEIKVGNTTLKAILCPGHSPGSLCFYSADHATLIGGDVLFRGSIGRTDLPGGNHKQLLDNIKNRIFTLPEETKVYSGHGGPTTVGLEKDTNPFF